MNVCVHFALIVWWGYNAMLFKMHCVKTLIKPPMKWGRGLVTMNISPYPISGFVIIKTA